MPVLFTLISARFDRQLMHPPGPSSAAADPALRAWCEGPEPFAVRAVAAPLADLDALAAELDGSRELARLGRFGGLALRLRAKAQDLRAQARPGDVWDCGWLHQPQSAEHFYARRPTLLLVPAVLAQGGALLGALQAAQARGRRPLRVLQFSLR